MIALLGIYYVWILNENATKGYYIRNLQVTNHELKVQANLLEVNIAQGQSIENIMESSLMFSMQNVEQPTFLVLKNSVVSLNE